jgi:mRNA interferase MazF
MKNFDNWNNAKKKVEQRPGFVMMREREIYWAYLGLNVGDEEDGKNECFTRPVLIVKKFNNRIAWVVPLSSKPGNPKYYYPLTHDGTVSFAMLSQMRLLSVKRLGSYIARLSRGQLDAVRKKLVSILYY